MSFILSGFVSREVADLLSLRAEESDRLGYPAVASFEEEEGSGVFRVDVYLQEAFDKTVLLEELGDAVGDFSLSELPQNVDWVKEGLKDLQPVHEGRFFVHGSHDSHLCRAHQHSILIEANQAFGTGHHGTTAGCLQAIAEVTKRHQFNGILDLGTGSGVLAIALAKQTKSCVLATDIDAPSIKIAKENMMLNGVSPLVACRTAAGFDDPVFKETGPFGLVVANILAGPLCTLARPMTEHLARNATIILSGLLIRQKRQVLAAYRAQGAFPVRAIHRNGWATLILRRV